MLDGGVRVNYCHCKIPPLSLSPPSPLCHFIPISRAIAATCTHKKKAKQFITFYKIIWMKMCRAGKIVNCNKLTHLQMNLHTIFRYCCCRCHTRMCFWFWCIFKCFRRWRFVLHLPLNIFFYFSFVSYVCGINHVQIFLQNFIERWHWILYALQNNCRCIGLCTLHFILSFFAIDFFGALQLIYWKSCTFFMHHFEASG